MGLNLGWTEFHFQLNLWRPMRRPLEREWEANCEPPAPEIVQLSFDDHPSGQGMDFASIFSPVLQGASDFCLLSAS
jgi:hypothetical protein